MGNSFIVPTKTATNHRERLQKKVCAFPGCNKIFKGTGKSKYCLEHRKRKYRKFIDEDKIARQKREEELKNPNQIIDHNYTNSVIEVRKCCLDGCENEFTIKIHPKTYVYPKYCNAHRNEFKRNLYLNGKK